MTDPQNLTPDELGALAESLGLEVGAEILVGDDALDLAGPPDVDVVADQANPIGPGHYEDTDDVGEDLEELEETAPPRKLLAWQHRVRPAAARWEP